MSNDPTPSEYVKLISADGFEFVIHREAAMRSGTIKNMLVGPGWTLRHACAATTFGSLSST